MDLQARKQPSSDDVFVTVKDARGCSSRGVVVDVDCEGHHPRVLIDFPAQKAPLLELGARAELVFAGVAMARPERGTGRVTLRTGETGRARFVFALEGDAMRSVSHGVNRRAAARVSPDPEAPVRLLVEAREGEAAFAPELRDLSVTGLCFRATRAELLALASWSVGLVLELPGEAEPLRLIGVVRYQAPAGDGAHVGVAFDFEHTPESEVALARLARHVAACQARAVARAARGRGGA